MHHLLIQAVRTPSVLEPAPDTWTRWTGECDKPGPATVIRRSWRPGFRDLSHRDNKSMVVHEAVHAMNDAFAVTLFPIDDEMAAYTTQALYYRHSGLKAPHLPKLGPDRNVNRIYEAAFALADAMLSGATDLSIEKSTLREFILFVPIYKGADARRMKYGGVDTTTNKIYRCG